MPSVCDVDYSKGTVGVSFFFIRQCILVIDLLYLFSLLYIIDFYVAIHVYYIVFACLSYFNQALTFMMIIKTEALTLSPVIDVSPSPNCIIRQYGGTHKAASPEVDSTLSQKY